MMEVLQTIYGIGPVMARSLIRRLIAAGYERERFRKDSSNPYSRIQIYRMLKTKEFWDSLPESARAYLTYLPDRAIPRVVIERLDHALEKVRGLRLRLGGSYSRGRATSNDADIVVSGRNREPEIVLERIAAGLAGSRTVEMLPPYAVGPDRISTMFRVQISGSDLPKDTYIVKSDIFIAAPEEYVFTLLYVIGSGGFNILMRAQAKRKGMLLNQRGLFDRSGKRLDVKTENDIFDTIGVTYRKPADRDIKTPKK